MKLLGITDHGPAMPDAPHLWHFHNYKILPHEICGVQMLYEYDGMLNVDVYDTAALKHGHGYKDAWEHEYLHPLSYLYKLRRIDVPDDFVNISREWDEKQFRAILPFMQEIIRGNHFQEVPEDVLSRFYLAKYYLYKTD